MSQLQQTETQSNALLSEKPAVGVLATGDNIEEVTRVTARAIARDHPVIIIHQKDAFVFTELGDLPDVRLISVDKEPAEDTLSDWDQLIRAAHAHSAPGLLYVSDTSKPVDFVRSLEQFNEGEFVQRGLSVNQENEVSSLVAIPAYNEAETIGKVVEDASRYADKIVVIDDGSTDKTENQAREAGATVVTHEHNQGYGAALQTAFQTAAKRDVDCLVIIDGDDQHDPSDIEGLSEMVTANETNVAIGSRFADDATGDIPLYRRVGLAVINILTNISMGKFMPKSWVHDTQSGFRAYDQDAIKVLSDAKIGNGMDASLDILYQLNNAGLHIEEVPTEINYDVEDGHSKNPIAHGISLVATILRTVEREHPILTLGVPGFVLTMAGLSFGYLTISNYLLTHTFPPGMGLATAFFILFGVFAGFTAIILHSLNTHLDS